MKTKLDKARAIVCILHRMAKLPEPDHYLVTGVAQYNAETVNRQLRFARAAYESAPSAYPFNPFA